MLDPSSNPSIFTMKTFLEIQEEQARTTGSSTNDTIHRGVGRGAGKSTTGGRGNKSSRYQQQHTATMPTEQGQICALKESFGFLKGADRNEDIFFHFGELVSPDEEPKIGDEMEFQVDDHNQNRISARNLKKLPPNTIQWETEDFPGERIRGLVERPPSTRASYSSSSSPSDSGTIRILMHQEDEEHATADGHLVRFAQSDIRKLPKDIIAEQKSSPSNSKRKGSSTTAGSSLSLRRGDFVEFTLVTERRTQYKYAREISLLMSEVDRQKHAEETEKLKQAKEEHGVVTSLKDGFGFLRSNKRRQEVFFHYSSVELEDHHVDDEEEFVLEEGQEVKFHVVEAGGEQRFSAHRVQAQPRGSVKFHDHIATAMTGVVLKTPQPQDAGHVLEEQGKIKLSQPVFDQHEDGSTTQIDEVFLFSRDSPGGHYAYKGGTAVGLWVEVGDTLLFDVVKDVVDGAFRAAPTAYHQPKENPLEIEEDANDTRPRSVRLISLTPAMRAEGEINRLKDGFGKDAFGFLHYADRPVDVHFKFHQLLPESIQNDLRLNMGIQNTDEDGKPLKLKMGAEVQFDLSVHGSIVGHKGKQTSHERENLKAQRILLLPPGTILRERTIATSVRGRILKQEIGKPFCGTIELDKPAKSMSHDQRHPLVAKLVDTCLKDDNFSRVVFRDLQTAQEDEIHKTLIESRGRGQLSWSHVEVPNETTYPGLFCITKNSKLEVTDDTKEENESDDQDHASGDEKKHPSPRRKGKKPKPVRMVYYDKSGIVEEDIDEEKPPSVGDTVTCDIVQHRRSGKAIAVNIRIIERCVDEEQKSVGIVNEVVPQRKFGLISVIDGGDSNNELLFFHMKAVVGNRKIRKGDEVKFLVGEEKNGKQVALEIEFLPKGTIPDKASEDACQGIVLLEPSNAFLLEKSVKHSSSKVSSTSEKDSRWSNVDNPTKKEAAKNSDIEKGFVLLTSDPSKMFSDESSPIVLRYKTGSLALYGAGASSPTDSKSNPKRGDLVSFAKTKNGHGIRDIRIVTKGHGELVRGNLKNIVKSENEETLGTAKFVIGSEEGPVYDVPLDRIISCDSSVLKENETVEGILYEGSVYGICRSSDLHLESKFGVGHKSRPKLNLNVKKDRGGQIMAQTMMAMGPDGTTGFSKGWTTRRSQYVSEDVASAEIEDQDTGTATPATDDDKCKSPAVISDTEGASLY